MDPDLRILSMKIHSVLLTFKNGAKGAEFLAAYKDCSGKPLSVGDNGFPDLPSFMRAMSEAVEIRKNEKGEELYIAKTLEATRSLQQLIAQQRSKDAWKKNEFSTPQTSVPKPAPLPQKQTPVVQSVVVAAPKKEVKKNKEPKKPIELRPSVQVAKRVSSSAGVGASSVPCSSATCTKAKQKKLPVCFPLAKKARWLWPVSSLPKANVPNQHPRCLTVDIVNVEGPNMFSFVVKDRDIVEAVDGLAPLMEREVKSTFGTYCNFAAGASVVVCHKDKCARAIICNMADPQFATVFLLDFAVFRTVPIEALELMKIDLNCVPQRGLLGSLVNVPAYRWDGFRDCFKEWLASEVADKNLIIVPACKKAPVEAGILKVPVYLYEGNMRPENELNKRIVRFCRKMMVRSGNLDKLFDDYASFDQRAKYPPV